MRVLLVHGLSRTRHSMGLLGRRLARTGHRPEYFSYHPFLESHRRIARRMEARLRGLAEAGEELALVGHSFGGLLLREGVARVPELRVRQLVMLGTPNRSPRMARLIYGRWPVRLLRGQCGVCLSDPSWYELLPPLACPYTLVAGTAGWRGRLSPFRDEPNDGIVAVSETLFRATDEPLLLPVLHSFMMNSRAVHRLITERL